MSTQAPTKPAAIVEVEDGCVTAVSDGDGTPIPWNHVQVIDWDTEDPEYFQALLLEPLPRAVLERIHQALARF